MKYIFALLAVVVMQPLVGCSTVPLVLADSTRPSIMETVITNGIDHPSYYWVLWYVPILVWVLGHAYLTFIKKDKK